MAWRWRRPGGGKKRRILQGLYVGLILLLLLASLSGWTRMDARRPKDTRTASSVASHADAVQSRTVSLEVRQAGATAIIDEAAGALSAPSPGPSDQSAPLIQVAAITRSMSSPQGKTEEPTQPNGQPPATLPMIAPDASGGRRELSADHAVKLDTALQKTASSQSTQRPTAQVPGAPVAPGIRLFGTVEFRGPLKSMPKWERVLTREKRSTTFARDLSATMRSAVLAQWKELIQRAQSMSTMEKIRAVNVFFNRWPYRTDQEVYHVEDYWAAPMEFMKNSGDCEDYAITKFYALIKLGVDPNTMRIIALMDKIRNLGHAVLVVYAADNAYVLDNLTDLVLPHDRFKHYAPQYSVNETYRWAHITPTQKR